MARLGDPTAFLTGVSALISAPSAEISDPTLELGRPPSQRGSGCSERRRVRGRGRVASSRDRQTVPARGRDTRALPLRAPGLQFPEDARLGGARRQSWKLLGIVVPASNFGSRWWEIL